jgi:hypothetical protein
MVDLTDAQIDAALARGRLARQMEPRAAAARYDQERDRIVVDLANGCALAFPPRLVGGLEDAGKDAVAAVEIIGAGYGLHWEALDIDLSVPGLVAALFGTSAYNTGEPPRVSSGDAAAKSDKGGQRRKRAVER